MRRYLPMIVLLVTIACLTMNASAQVQNSDYVIVTDTLYPMDMDYWTGTTDGSAKTDISEVRTNPPELGWMTFDISSIPGAAVISSITLNGFVNSTNFPFWSGTPMGSVYPVTDPASAIYSQVSANTGQGVAYIYSDESFGFSPGWHSWEMGNGAVPDLQAAVSSSQGWFAVGIYDRDQAIGYYINFDGWNEPNHPYIVVDYEYSTPVEITLFTANVSNSKVTLNWKTATETNNKGFEIERSQKSGVSPSKTRSRQKAESQYEWMRIGYVEGNGTTTESHHYYFTDEGVQSGKYQYRLKQIDFDGSYEYSKIIEAKVFSPGEFSLEQNYPNPFNPATSIKFSIPKKTFVTLKVYDILGSEAATLVNDEKAAGVYTLKFNAEKLSSGLYLYTLKSGSYTSTKKMLLIK